MATIESVTDNIKTVLESLDSYGGTPTVELERLFIAINGRYPYISIEGPYDQIERRMHQQDENKLEYVIKYYVRYNDEEESSDEITYVTRNVGGDMIEALMADVTRGGSAIITKVTHYGNSFEVVNENVEFFRYVRLEVTLRTEATDPSLVG